MRGYGQFCAIAQAAEVLTERWTPLVLRELALTGSRRFNDIHHLTPAGEELGPVFAQLGVWSERWLRRPIFEETPDTGLLMWWVRTTVKTDELPPGRTVIHFHFRGAPEKLRNFWLVLPEADLCLSDPGFGVDISVSSDPKTMTAVWMGDLGLAAALSSRAIELEGRRQLERSFPKWFGLHPLFATIDHPTSRPRISA